VYFIVVESSVMHRLEMFTTDAKISRLISRRVGLAVFFRRRRRINYSTAIATELIWKILPVLRPFGLLRKGMASPLTKSCVCHCT